VVVVIAAVVSASEANGHISPTTDTFPSVAAPDRCDVIWNAVRLFADSVHVVVFDNFWIKIAVGGGHDKRTDLCLRLQVDAAHTHLPDGFWHLCDGVGLGYVRL